MKHHSTEQLKAALSKAVINQAKRQQKKELQQEMRSGLCEQDHEMFNRIWDRIAREERIPFRERGYTQPHPFLSTKGSKGNVDGGVLSGKTKRRTVTANPSRRSKNTAVLDADSRSKLSLSLSRFAKVNNLGKRRRDNP